MLRVVVALAALSALAACSALIYSETSGYSGTCQLPHAGDNACGQCVTQNCQNEINADCADTNGSAGSLDSCMQDPSPGNGGSCSNYTDDASVHQSTTDTAEAQLRACVFNNCLTPCTACLDITFGNGGCGTCMQTSCGYLLQGSQKCCSTDYGVSGDVSQATAPNNASCNNIDQAALNFKNDNLDNDGGFLDGGFARYVDAGPCTEYIFAACVEANCQTPCGCTAQ